MLQGSLGEHTKIYFSGENPPYCAVVSWHDISRAKACAAAQDLVKAGLAMSLWGKLSSMPDEDRAAIPSVVRTIN